MLDSSLDFGRIGIGVMTHGTKEQGIPGFYAGYFRDLDGNKLNVFFMASAAE